MSTSPQHSGRHDPPSRALDRVRRTDDLFSHANVFLEAIWTASEEGMCLSSCCGDCGNLPFRRVLAAVDGEPSERPVGVAVPRPAVGSGRLAAAVARVDFALLRLTPRWYDALDIALFHLRDRGQLGGVIEDWVRRPTLPPRVLDLVLFRHARYGYPCERLSDQWIDRCLDAACEMGDEGLVESLILCCPERVGADPRAMRAALEAAGRSACVRAVVRRLGDCA